MTSLSTLYRQTYWGILLLLLSGVACKGPRQAQPAEAPASQAVSFTVIEQQISCGIPQPQNRWIQDGDSWQELWQQAFSDRWPQPEAPEIDFEQYQVLACFLGTCTSGGHQLDVASLAQTGDILTVSLAHRMPGPRCVVTEALTQPFVIIQIPLLDLQDVQFQTQNTTNPC